MGSIFSEQILLSRQQQPHARGDDRERITRARQAAEALFTSNSPNSPPAVRQTAPADPAARKPRVLRITAPAAPQPETPVAGEPSGSSVSASQVARIRRVKYGMTVPQIAKVCGVSVGEVERVLRRA
jgi:DNA-directed RNA polymerase specialized sigma24 family protein